MSLKNFIDRMRKRILDRRAQKKPRSSGRLRVTRLEERKLLDASFGIGAAGILTLDSFDGGDAVSLQGDFSSGAGSITLESGIWDAVQLNPGFVLSNDGATLNVNTAVNGINIQAQDSAASVNDGANGLQVAALAIAGAGNVTLDSADNDFDSLSVSADSVSITDVDDLVLHDVTASHDIMVQAGDDLFIDGAVTSSSDTAEIVLNAGSDGSVFVADVDAESVDASSELADVEPLTNVDSDHTAAVNAVPESLSQSEITEVVFVDSRVGDSQTLVDGLRDGVEIVFLDADSDGLQQIADYSATHDGLDAIHIVSHGSAGQLYLGSTTLNDASLGDYTATLTTIGDSLTDSGDLLLYGCNVAEGVDGAEFIQHLAAATGADVAASVDVTGAAFLGGDWDLESSDGTIEAGIAFGQAAIGSYSSVLGVPTAAFALNSAAANQGGSLTFTVTFSEEVSEVDQTDFELVTTGTVSFGGQTAGDAGDLDPATYEVTVSGVAGEGTLGLTFAAGTNIVSVTTSEAVDPNPTANGVYTIDSVGPTAAFTAPGTNPTNSSSVTFDVNFHEAVTGVDAADFALSLSGVTADAAVTVSDAGDFDASTYQVTVTNIAGEGTVNLDFASGATITDAIGNAVNTTPTADETYNVDTVLPTVQSIARVTAEDTNADSVDFTVTFAEDVTGVGTGDFVLDADAGVTGATIASVSGSGSTYTVTVNSVDGDGTLSIDFDADADGGVTDLIGNISTADFASGEAYAIDNTPPAVPTITSFSDDTGASTSDNITNDNTLTINGSTDANATVEIFDGATSLGTTTANGSGDWAFTTGALANGNHSLTATSTDAVGNTSVASAALNVTTDTQAPTVDRIVRSAAAAEATQAASVDFTVTFAEAVTGVTAADFVLTQVGGVDAAISSVTAVSAAEYTVTVNTGSGGTIGLDFDADADVSGGVTDIAGNDGIADFTSGETYAASSSVVSLSGGNVTFSDVGNASSDNLTVVINGGNLRISDPTTALLAGTGFTQVDSNTIEIALGDITTSQLTFTTGDGADTLTVDFSAGYFTNNIVFNGGGPAISPGDLLIINGGTFSSITKGFTSSSSGYVFLGSSTIGYNELEPVLLNVGSVTDLVFELPASDNNVILEDDGPAMNGISQIRSGNGSFETTTFTSPTGSLTIRGNAGAFNDAFTIDALPDFNAAADLTITSNGTGTDTVDFAAAVAVDALTVNVTGAITDSGAATVTTTGNASFTGSSIALNDTYNFASLTFNSAGAVAITEDSATDIVGVNTAGSLDLESIAGVSDAGATSVAVTGLTDVTGTSISLGGGTFNTGTLTFNSAGAVGISEGSATDIVGVNTALSLDLDSTGAIDDGGATSIAVTNLADVEGTAITLGAGTFNAGTLAVNSAGVVTVSEDSDTDLVVAAGSTVNLTSTGAINDAVSDVLTDVTATSVVLTAATGIGAGEELEISATNVTATTTTGNIDLDSALATAVDVATLVTGSGTIEFDHAGTVGVTFSGPVTSGGGVVSLTSDSGLVVDGVVSSAGAAGGALAVSGATLNATPIVGADITIAGGSVDTVIATDLTNAGDLTLSALRDVLISGAVSTTAGGGITITADSDGIVNADGTGSALGGVLIAAGGQLNSAGTVDVSGSDLLNGAATGTGQSILIAADGTNSQIVAVGDITLAGNAAPATADVVINGFVTSTTGDISITSADEIQTATTIEATAGSIDFNDAVLLTGGTTIIAGANATFDLTVNGAFDLSLDVTGATTFVGAVGATAAIGDGTGAAISIIGDGTTEFQGTVATGSGIAQANNADAVTFRDNITAAAGNTGSTFDGNVVLDELIFTSGGTITFGNLATDTVTTSVAAVGITTAVANVDVIFNAATTANSDLTVSVGTGSITVNAVVDGNANNANIVYNSAGITDINAAIGSGTAVASLTTDAPGTTTLAANVTAQGGTITINDPLVLNADVILADSGTTGIFLNNTVDSDNTARDLTLTTTDAAASVSIGNEAGDTVGGISALDQLTVNAAGTLTQTANIADVAQLTYDAAGAITVTGSTAVAGNIDIDSLSTIEVSNTITTTAGGTVDIDGTDLTTLSSAADINADGAVTFGAAKAGELSTAADVTTTSDAITFNTPVTLTGDVVLNTGAGIGTVTFASPNGTVNGTHDLTISAGTGNVEFDAVLGASAALDDLNITSANQINFDAAITAATVTANATTIDGNGLVTATTIDLDAVNGIGATTALNLNAVTLNATNTTSDVIDINEADSVAVGIINNGNRAVTLDAGGSITDGNGGTTNVTAGLFTVDAAGGIDLDTDIATLSATNATSGSININEADGVALDTISNAARAGHSHNWSRHYGRW